MVARLREVERQKLGLQPRSVAEGLPLYGLAFVQFVGYFAVGVDADWPRACKLMHDVYHIADDTRMQRLCWVAPWGTLHAVTCSEMC